MGAKLGGGGGGKGLQPNSEPNVIPFIDIMLVLLIIFMVASPPPTVDIKIDIPPDVPNPPKQEQLDKPTFVIQDDDGAGNIFYFIGDSKTPLSLEALGSELRTAAFANNPTKQSNPERLFLEGKIYVKADQQVEYSHVIELMQAIDKAGFKAVSLVVEAPASGT